MTALALPVARPRLRIDREWAVILLFMAAAACFLFVDMRAMPIVLWDESRTVVNAMEMHRTGLSLVTTYEFQPDLWNTKPPLLIWLMVGSVSLFGASEWALRLPSALAALGTILMVLLFTRRVTGSLGTALAAAAILAISPGFYADHSARTADFDALLTFLATAYLWLIFEAVRRKRPPLRLLAGAGLAIAAAVLTKAVAGLVPGAGVAVYLLLTRRLPRLWRTPHYLVMTVMAIAPVVLFYLAREAAAPGYLEAALHNDLVGRFSESLVGRTEPVWFYLEDAMKGWFFAGPLLLVAPFGIGRVRGKSRLLLRYSLSIALTLLAVLSLSSTKLTHYFLPAYPMLAIAAALMLRGLLDRVVARAQTPPARLALVVAVSIPLALLGARAGFWRYVSLHNLHDTEPGRYGELFPRLAARGIGRATVVDPGFRLNDWATYAPILRSYQLIWAARGLATDRIAEREPGAARGVLVTCHLATAPRLLAIGPDLAGVEGCAAVRTAS